MNKENKKLISAEEFEKLFDEGGPILKHVDQESGVWRVNVDIPVWALGELDREAKRFGITRQSLIKIWLIERIDQIKKERRLTQSAPIKPKPKKMA